MTARVMARDRASFSPPSRIGMLVWCFAWPDYISRTLVTFDLATKTLPAPSCKLQAVKEPLHGDSRQPHYRLAMLQLVGKESPSATSEPVPRRDIG